MQHSMNSFFITHGIGDLHIFNYFGMIWYLRLLTTFPPPRAQAMADFASRPWGARVAPGWNASAARFFDPERGGRAGVGGKGVRVRGVN